MKNAALALTLLLTLSANKCAKNAPDAASLHGKKWVFQTLNGEAVKMPEGVEQPWLQITDDGVSGFGGCNRLMGSYELAGDKLSFPGLASTRIYCEATQATEQNVLSALNRVDAYTFDGGLLKLLQGSEVVATLKGE